MTRHITNVPVTAGFVHERAMPASYLISPQFEVKRLCARTQPDGLKDDPELTGWSLVTKVACGRLSDPAGRNVSKV